MVIPKEPISSLQGVRIAVDSFWSNQAEDPIANRFFEVVDFLRSKGKWNIIHKEERQNWGTCASNTVCV